MNRLTGAIFDLDGTLADTLQVCFAAFRAAFEQLGAPKYSDAQIRALFGPSEEGMMQRAIPDRWQEAVAGYLAEYETHLPICGGVFPAVTTALGLLRERGIPMALVTGRAPPARPCPFGIFPSTASSMSSRVDPPWES